MLKATAPDLMRGMEDKDVTEEIIIAAISALAEQLDADRAREAIYIQIKTIAASGLPRCEEVADGLTRIGIALDNIAEQRRRKKPAH